MVMYFCVCMDQDMKVRERIIAQLAWKRIKLGELQFGFAPRGSTTDALV